MVISVPIREAKKQWPCPLCPKGPETQEYALLYRHLRGYHHRTPNQARALLPEGYQPRPPRRRSQPEAEADEDSDDEEGVDNPPVYQDVSDDDARTASTVIQTPLVTPVVSAQGSPVLHRWAPVQDELYRGEGVVTPAVSVRADETGTLPPPTPEPSRQGSRTLTRSDQEPLPHQSAQESASRPDLSLLRIWPLPDLPDFRGP